MKRIKILYWLWLFIKRSFNGWFESKRKCPIGETDCDTCPFRLQCTFHLLDGNKQ